MDPFEVYKIYMSLKLHFTTKDYDITKAKSAVRCKRETFAKRKDIFLFRKLAKKYDFRTLVDYFVANFVAGHNGVFDGESDAIYNSWKSRQEKLGYQFSQDINLIIRESEEQNIDPLISTDGQHPLFFKLYLGNKISIETVIILDKLFDVVYNNLSLSEDFLWKDFSLLVTKYRKFIRIDRDKYRKLWIKEKGQVVS